MLGGHAVFLHDLIGAEDHHIGDALLGGDDAGEVRCQLTGILVSGDQQRLESQLLIPGGDGPKDVIPLPPGHLHHRDAHGLEKLLDDGELDMELIVHLRPLGLVFGHLCHAELRLTGIEGADHRIGFSILSEFAEHLQESEYGVGGRAVLG